jgi:hypothetical protein
MVPMATNGAIVTIGTIGANSDQLTTVVVHQW